ncbi:MAG: Gfo/Idh/MocA family oxidoreductase [Pirellulaceae bacterium]|jgi:predicted dehydrogenase|nr:Gfo/Idh/MocA family oxidoreductase [Pirellulaceae bacterium]HJN07448.1 Gfo/Idh/MocA family oxidoreductase [Pirellulaceae bacterium]
MAITRRQFVKRSAATAAVVGIPMVAPSRVLGANEEIRVGLVGLGGRGRGAHVPGFEGQKGVTVVAISDADQQRMGSTAEMIQSKYGHKVEQFTDMRKMFDRKDIDVIGNATQNYWHGLSTVWACQAGKHVYVEKPLSHYIGEGRQMVDAARKYDRIVQCGTQHRSEAKFPKAIQWIREGHLGKIKYVTAFANKPRSSCGRRETPLPISDYVDYDLWCGPAKKVPLYRNKLHYDCSFDWNTGDGESCNQGVHEVDVARWCLGETMLPRRVMSIGGRFSFNDACDVPNTQIIYYDFPTAPLLYEVHNLRQSKGVSETPDYRGERVGVIVNCEGGLVSLYRGIAWDNDGKQVQTFTGGGDHFANFIGAVRNGRREDLNAEVEVGHASTAVCHVGNISYRVGQVASATEQRAAVRDVPVWNKMYDRFAAHLKANEIDINTATLGPWLEVDRQNERFKDHDEANRLVQGFYRKPYVVSKLT